MADQVEPVTSGAQGGRTPLLLVISWLWVGVPLAWGVIETLRTSLALFR